MEFPNAVRRYSILAVVLVAVVAVAGLLLWRNVIRDRVIVKRFGVVVPGQIYRSGQISPFLISDVLESNGIRCVIDLQGDDPNNPHQPDEVAAIQRLGIRRVLAPLIGDGTGDPQQYVHAVRQIVECQRNGEPVLVHCYAGSQRTGGVIAAYRLLVENRPVDEVLAEMRAFGWAPERDRVLLDYLNTHLPEIANDLDRDGTVRRVSGKLPTLR